MYKSVEKHVVIVGAGPSGLFTAYELLRQGFTVDLYDHSSGPGKKFLVAGNGGLILSHSEKIDEFQKKYSQNEPLFTSLIKDFTPEDLRDFCRSIGVETFIGSSGRIFPTKLSAASMIRSWVNALKKFNSFNIHLNYKVTHIQKTDDHFSVKFYNSRENKEISIQAKTLVLALGGGSWKKTGSDGCWVEMINSLGIKVVDFSALNCGYEVRWSNLFKEKIGYSFLKNISVNGRIGELMLTPYGIEGSLIYANSKKIQGDVEKRGNSLIKIDLRPNNEMCDLMEKLKKKRVKDSRKNQLRKCLKISSTEHYLVNELLNKEEFYDDMALVNRIKSLPIRLHGARPLDEAISTGGGISFNELTENLESKKFSGLYFAGEMVDWDAPTGGYLLQGCFSMAKRVATAISRPR